MTASNAGLSLEQAIENIYTSLQNDNDDIDNHIEKLKAAMAEKGVKAAVFEPARLVQNNRQGRKMMESYFKKRGVTVTFAS